MAPVSKKKSKEGLNERQKKFCREYVIDLNGTQAAIRAGYSKKTACPIAVENLLKPPIIKYVKELIDKRANKLDITAERVLAEMAKIAFIDIKEFYNEDGTIKSAHELSAAAAASMSGVEVNEMMIGGKKVGQTKKIKSYDKVKALESLFKHLGLYNQDNLQKKPDATIFYLPKEDKAD